MRRVFVDNAFYIAYLDSRGDLHVLAAEVAERFIAGGVIFVTSHAVLAEVLAYFSNTGSFLRQGAVDLARSVLDDATVVTVDVDDNLLRRAIELYERRPDKAYSLTDCVSMIICRDQGITEVLTSDKDFEQEGFTRLLVAPA